MRIIQKSVESHMQVYIRRHTHTQANTQNTPLFLCYIHKYKYKYACTHPLIRIHTSNFRTKIYNQGYTVLYVVYLPWYTFSNTKNFERKTFIHDLRFYGLPKRFISVYKRLNPAIYMIYYRNRIFIKEQKSRIYIFDGK